MVKVYGWGSEGRGFDPNHLWAPLTPGCHTNKNTQLDLSND